MSESDRPADSGFDLSHVVAQYGELLRAFEDVGTRLRLWASEHQEALQALALLLQGLSSLTGETYLNLFMKPN